MSGRTYKSQGKQRQVLLKNHNLGNSGDFFNKEPHHAGVAFWTIQVRSWRWEEDNTTLMTLF